MKRNNQFKFLALLVALAYVLSACTGALPATNANQGQDNQPQEVVFTGTVEAMGGGEWTISGQAVTVSGNTKVDAKIMVGTNVRVEAVVDQNGVVTAVSIETAGADDTNANANSNDDNGNDANGNDANANANTNGDDNGNSNANSNGDDNGNSNANGNSNSNGNDSALTGTEKEVTGKVDAISSTSITIDGVAYDLSTKTEFKGAIAVGDTVKVHVVTSADGKQTIREIEKMSGTVIGGNSNDNGNSNDDHGGNSNGSDDNGNSNDDNGGNSNGSDDNGNSNDNGNGGNDNGGNGNGNG